MNTIQMPIWTDYHILSKYIDDNKNTILTCMTYITEDEEKQLDHNKTIHLLRGTEEFKIEPKQVYCYGNVNLNTNSTDYNIIENFTFLNFLKDVGLKIYSDYDYETHTCKSPIDRCRWTETWNPAEIVQYAHGVLNKPPRIVLFKYVKGK